MSMSDPQTLYDKVGDAEVFTLLAPEGDRWVSSVKGGVRDGYVSAMDKSGDPAVLHAQVIAFLNEPEEPAP